MLALLTVLIAILFWFIPDVSVETILCTAIAALCLFIVVPFEARNPPARKRVLAGCVAYVVMIGVALGFAFQGVAERVTPMGALAALAFGGLILVIWSFGIRNRVSRPQWRDYYDR
jgi:O-antigen/teichoic acid export membrane protein